ncbi:hypothetical protein CR513_44880, partial [Mucuna pruriens]
MFGTDVMIPIKVRELSLRRSSFDHVENLSFLRTNFDLVNEAREMACIRRCEEEKRRREAHGQLGRTFLNLGITRQRCISTRTVRWHEHTENVEFHAPQHPLDHSNPSKETLKHPKVHTFVEHPSDHSNPSKEILKHSKMHLFVEHPSLKHPKVHAFVKYPSDHSNLSEEMLKHPKVNAFIVHPSNHSEQGNAQALKGAPFCQAPFRPLIFERGNAQVPKGARSYQAPLRPLKSERGNT